MSGVDNPGAPGRRPLWFRILFAFMRNPAELDAHQWKLVGLLGATIVLNHYDFMVLNLALSQIQVGLGVAEGDIGSVVAYTRLGVIPALLLALVADRVGRRRLLLITVVGFTVCTSLTAFARDINEFTGLQILARMFINAEEMLAIVVIAEELGANNRGFGLGVLAAMGSLGAGLAAVVFGFVDMLPYGWRSLYLVGVVPLFYLVFDDIAEACKSGFRRLVGGRAAPSPSPVTHRSG